MATRHTAAMTIERQNGSGVWQTVASAVPCTLRPVRGQAAPASAQPDAGQQGQRLYAWRVLADVGTGIQIKDRLTIVTSEFGTVCIVIGAITQPSMGVCENAFGTREEWAGEQISITLIRYDQVTDTETTLGPVLAGRIQDDPRSAGGTSDGSAGALMTVTLRLPDADPHAQVGDIVPELAGGVVRVVRPAVDQHYEIEVAVDAGIGWTSGGS
jgi:hypothetical protein